MEAGMFQYRKLVGLRLALFYPDFGNRLAKTLPQMEPSALL
jgi:hypothetical protein